MEEKAQLVLIPNYTGFYNSKVDDKHRLKLPEAIRRVIRERNRYNIMGDDFRVEPYRNGRHTITFYDVPFAEIRTEG